MKKLIDTYSKMEKVTPAAIQLIFKGNPIAERDTPTKINLQNLDNLEVCRVPGVHTHLNPPEISETGYCLRF